MRLPNRSLEMGEADLNETPPHAFETAKAIAAFADASGAGAKPTVAFHALLVLAAANDPAAIRAIEVPGATDEQATTLRLIGEGLIAVNEGEPRAALDCLLESLSGLPSIGGSRVQQEVILETALAAMLQLGAPGQAARLLSRYRSTPGPQVTRGAVN